MHPQIQTIHQRKYKKKVQHKVNYHKQDLEKCGLIVKEVFNGVLPNNMIYNSAVKKIDDYLTNMESDITDKTIEQDQNVNKNDLEKFLLLMRIFTFESWIIVSKLNKCELYDNMSRLETKLDDYIKTFNGMKYQTDFMSAYNKYVYLNRYYCRFLQNI
jgi:hypothetical protein